MAQETEGAGGGTSPQKKIEEKYLSGNYYVTFGHFSGKNHVKFGNCVNFSGKYHKNYGILIFVSGKNHAKFRHFVNFSHIFFWHKYLTES